MREVGLTTRNLFASIRFLIHQSAVGGSGFSYPSLRTPKEAF